MADIESNIDINIDTSDALANLKRLQAQISSFHQTMSKGGAATNAQLAQMRQNLINGINATGKFSATIQKVSTTTESFTTALEKNKLSMGQYFRYAGSQVTGFRKLFSGEFDTIEKVARERVKTLQTQYIKLGRDASGAMQSIAVRPLALDMQDLGTKTAVAAQKQQIFNQLIKQGSTNLLNFGKNTQWAGRQLMVGFTIPLTIFGTTAAREFMKIEEQVIRFQRVYGDLGTSTEATKEMTTAVKELASEFTKYGVSVEKTMGVAADAAAMGKQGADLLAQVTETTRLAVLGGVEQQVALETTTSLTNAFGVSTEKLAGKINFLNAVENQTVTSIEDLTEAIPKAGPVIQQLGGDVEDLSFFLTAMKEGGINASEGANALKSGLASLINPTAEASKMLGGFGINIEGIVNANKGDVKGIVIGFAQALDKLDPLNRAQAIEQLFGKFQFARMSTLFQNVIAEGSQASKVLELSRATAEELAVLSERELAKVENTTTYKFKKAWEDMKASLAPVGEAFLKAVTPIIEFGTKILEKFNEMSDGSKQFVTILVAGIAGIGPIFLMTFGLIANGVANLIKGFAAVSGFFKRLGGQSTTLGQQTDYMTQQQLEAAAVAASLNQVHSNLIQTFTSEASAVKLLRAEYERAAAAQDRMRGPIVPGGRGKTPKKYAKGVSFVPGTGKKDSEPAMLMPGEAVIPADMVKKYAPLIDGMVAGNIPGYARGKGSGSAGRVGKSGTTVSRPYLENVSNTGGVVGFTDLLGDDLADLSNMYANEIASAAGVSVGKIAKEVQEWEKANSAAINEATAAVNAGADPGKAYKKLIEKFKSDMQKAGGPVAKFTQTATAMFPALSKDLAEAQAYARKMKLDVKKAADATKLAQALPNNMIAQSMATPGNYQSSSRARQTGVAMFGGGNVEKYGIPRFMVDPTSKPNTRAYKAATSQEHFSETPAHAANLAKLRGQQVAAETKTTKATQRKAAAAEASAVAAETDAKSQVRSDAARRGWETRRLKAEQKLATQAEMEANGGGMGRRGGRMGKMMGRVGGAGMVASGLVMGASMMPGPVGEAASAAAGPMMIASSLSSILPAIMPLITANPVITAVVAALAALAVVIGVAVNNFNSARDAALKLSKSLGASQESLKKFGEFAGKVSAGEIRDKQRAQAITPEALAPGQETFGASFLESDAGKQMAKDFTEALDKQGKDVAKSMFAEQLANAVSSGVLNMTEAKSVAYNLASEMGDLDLGIKVNGELNNLFGPNGEDLAKDPLGVRIKIIDESQKTFNKVLAENTQMSVAQGALEGAGGWLAGGWLVGGIAIMLDYFGKLGEAGGMIAGAMTNTLSLVQEQIDALELDYQKRIQIAKAAGDVAKVAQLENELIANRTKLLEEQAQVTSQVIGAYRAADPLMQGAITSGAIKSVEDAYKGTKQEKAAEEAKNAIINAPVSNEKELVLLTRLASKDMQPEQMTALMKSFTTPGALNKAVNLIMKMDAGSANQATYILGLLKDETTKTEFLTSLEFDVNGKKREPGEIQEYVEQFARISKLQNVGDVSAIMSFYVKNPQALEKLKTDLATLDSLGNVDFTAYANVIGAPELLQMTQYADMFNQLPAESRKEFISTYQTIYTTSGTPEFQKELAAQNAAGFKGGKGTAADLAAAKAAKSTNIINAAKNAAAMAKYQEDVAAYEESGGGGGGGGGGGEVQKVNTLDNLLKKLRDVRSATTAMTKGWNESRTALDSLFGSGIPGFNGLQQKMRGLGAGEDLITLIAGMDPDEYERRKNELFVFDAAGNIVQARQSLLSLAAAMRSIAIGDFQDKQQKTVNTIRDQQIAVQKLVGAGLSYADAYEAVQDAAYASAIANEKNNEVIRQSIKDANAAAVAQKNLAAAQALAGSTEATADQAKLYEFLTKNAGKLTDAQTQAILGNKDLQTLALSPQFDPNTFQDALNNVAKQTEIDLKLKKLTIKGMEEVFQDGFGKAMEAFTVKEKEINLKFKVQKDPINDALRGAQERISDIQNAPGGIDDLDADLTRIGDKEIDINKKYDKRLSALDEIAKINDRFTKQQKAQLGIADALSQGDIAAAARQAQEMRAAQAADAVQDQRSRLEKSRERELANLTSTMGLTREQIETKIRDLRREIFEIEEGIVEPAQRQLELLDRQEQTEIRSLTVLGRTKDEWETIQNKIDTARVNSDSYTKAIEGARDVVSDILEYWNDIDGKEVSVDVVVREQRLNLTTPDAAGNVGPAAEETTGGGGGGGGTPPPTAPTEIPMLDEGGLVEDTALDFTKTGWWATLMAFGKLIDQYVVQPFLTAIKPITDWIKQYIVDPVMGWVGQLFKPLTDLVTWIFAPADMAQKMGDIERFFLEISIKINEFVRDFINFMLPALQVWDRLFGTNYAEEAKANIQKIEGGIQGLKDRIAELPIAGKTAMDGLASEFGTFTANAQVSMDGIKQKIQGLPEETRVAITEQLPQHFDSAADWANTDIDKIRDGIKDLPVETQDAIMQDLVNNFAEFQRLTDTEIQQTKDALNTIPEDTRASIVETLPANFTTFRQLAYDDIGTLVTSLKAMPDNTRDAIMTQMPANFEQMAKDAGIDISGLEQSVKNIPGNTKQSTTVELPANFDIGANKSKGSVEGIKGKIGELPGSMNSSMQQVGDSGGTGFKGAVNKIFGQMRQFDVLGFKPFAGLPTLYANGGLVPGFGNSDTHKAMLTPGEFVIRKDMVSRYGSSLLEQINSGTFGIQNLQKPAYNKFGSNVPSKVLDKNFSGSVYNNTYSINVNVKSDADAEDIARTVMTQIKNIDAQRIRGNRF